jgi:anti-sigma factor ChrR (cupin superfamily)
MTPAIRHDSDEAEAEFDRLVQNAMPTENAKDGDRIVIVDNQRGPVEIKQCTAPPGKTGTINQVRAIKCIPLVIWAKARNCWFVIPADELVRIAAGKSRGQHTEVSFESMNLSLKGNDAEWHHFRCADGELNERVMAAVRRTREKKDILALMQSLKGDLSALNQKYKDKVQEAFGD